MSILSEDRWRVVSPYLDRVLDMDPRERDTWLASLGAENPTLAADLHTLIRERSAVSRDGFLEGTVDSRSPSLEGHTIGAYRLVSPLGQGGMGSVWLAERSDGRFEGRAAVKLLNSARLGRGGEERFSREGSILARLTHANIAHLIDAGVSSTAQPYIVLEYVDGEPIDRYCDRQRLGIEARIRLFLDVLDAVAHAHANLIVHRDLKPSNVFVRSDGCVKLLDFGIAKLLEDDAAAAPLTVEGSRVLTPEYAAPEQMTGGQITTATDVYALGVLLYVLLGGQHPAGTTSRAPADLLKAIVETPPRRLSEIVTTTRASGPDTPTSNAANRATTPERLRHVLHGDLDNISSKALKKNPHERYPSVVALADDLRRYLDKQPISARPDTLAYRTAKFAQRHTRAVIAAAAVVVLLASLVGFYTARLTAERDRARLEAEKAAKVSELLTGLLTGSDPWATPEAGREPTVRGLLDAGAARVQKELAGQPELQAEMMTVIGRVYQRLGVPEKAQALLEAALATGRSVIGPEHPRVAQSLNDLGVLLREKGDRAAAGPMLEQALEMRRRLLGPEDKDVAVTLVELGRLYVDQNTPDRAAPLFREALAIRRKVLGDEHRETATSMSDLALLLWQKGDLASAEPLFRSSLAVSRKALGEDHPNVASSLNNLALILLDRGEYAEAESNFRQALSIQRRKLGERHRSVGNTLNNMSHALREQKKHDEAVSALEEALGIARPVLGNDHPVVAMYTVNMARVHLARGQAAVAEPMLRQALQTRRRVYAEDDWRVGATKSLLGASLLSLGRHDEAEPLLLDANKVLKDIPGPQGREAAATRARLAALYDALGRPERAAQYRR
jgi:serine/threonine protein kinase/Tfp pilus assembly protein PilF